MSDEIVERPIEVVAEETLTIPLTGRRPVSVRAKDWPTIASGDVAWHQGQYDFQAPRKLTCEINIQQHADGRCIVHGCYDYETQFQDEEDIRCFAGALAPKGLDSIGDQIALVAETLIEQVPDSEFHRYIRQCASECVADLPAETIE